MKYIFLAGAPGSKWSSVAKNIYYSADIDRSDYRDDWTYYHDASGQMELMHLGAYFDPGMACPLPEDLTVLDRAQLEESFAYPFNKDSTGIRIIKSHIFAYEKNIRHLRRKFVDCAIVLVHRSDDACLGWWVKCGHFNITYPDYHEYYRDLRTMAGIIAQQNDGIEQVIADTPTAVTVRNNHQLCRVLGIDLPSDQYWQNYAASDIKVSVL
jgi:hypothetical protein